jgi:hypothetical protein
MNNFLKSLGVFGVALIFVLLAVYLSSLMQKNKTQEIICKSEIECKIPNIEYNNLEEDCKPYEKIGYANGMVMPIRIQNECKFLNADNLNSTYKNNPNCDAQIIIEKLYEDYKDQTNLRWQF